MEGQISIFELYPDMQEVPEVWECMKTCANCGKYMDKFPIDHHGDRCIYGLYQVGTSGDDLYQVVDSNSLVHFYCKYYERKKNG